jgi:hypothetical protein
MARLSDLRGNDARINGEKVSIELYAGEEFTIFVYTGKRVTVILKEEIMELIKKLRIEEMTTKEMNEAYGKQRQAIADRIIENQTD